jgi:phosphatidate cytidylyltransferase
MLQARLISGTMMVAVALAILVLDQWFAPWYPLFGITVAVVAFRASGETARLISLIPLPIRPNVAQAGAVVVVVSAWIPHLRPADGGTAPPSMLVSLGVFTAAALSAFVVEAWEFRKPGGSIVRCAAHVFVIFYIGLLGAFFAEIRWIGSDPKVGAILLFFTIFSVKSCDIGAYFTGRLIGRNKLAPVLSPGKTWEGFFGGLVFGQLCCALIVSAAESLFVVKVMHHWEAALIGLLAAMLGQVGDLVESMIKRDCREKDAAAEIPGFGGMMDVIDSVIFFAPAAYFLYHQLGIVSRHL